MGRKGGKSGTGLSKTRTTENYKKAAEARWGNRAEVFWSRVSKTTDDSCWIYNGKKDHLGYSRQKWKGKNAMTYWISWWLTNGEIPDGKQLNHKCNNPSCVRPDHLYAGTQSENMRDRHNCGKYVRFNHGNINGKSKLNDLIVLEIRRLFKTGETLSNLGKKFNVTSQCVSSVIKRKTWTHI